ncbi:MAG: hypothetical protein JWN32_3890 [Solirubrobacterales bacterium]|jgi:hypothetical protein|nr:hypothetical protein [Solirubrobacterales bacterium]
MSEHPEEERDPETGRPSPGSDPDRPGPEGGSEESRDRPPAVPSDDDAEAGDTDQHSSSGA